MGGQKVEQTLIELGSLGPADQITINQMYVEYMVPRDAKKKVPVIMLHGATLSGKTYDTTPDGRMGWYEYFVRQGHSVYVVDQVGRGRSGFNQAVFNDVRAGIAAPASQPSILRLGDRIGTWTNFRFGPTPGVPFPDTQFPIEAADKFSKQGIPDLNSGLPPDETNPTFKALADLAIQADGAVLIGHSQGARQPTPAALIDPRGFSGLILIEPGNCTHPTGPTLTDEQIAKLATLPILVVFGDHLEQLSIIPPATWLDNFKDCEKFIGRLKDAGGDARMLYPPALGIYGNTHMMMQDKNNLQIADLILDWIDRHAKVKGRKRHGDRDHGAS